VYGGLRKGDDLFRTLTHGYALLAFV
jgi:hypothetical protein